MFVSSFHGVVPPSKDSRGRYFCKRCPRFFQSPIQKTDWGTWPSVRSCWV